ncbi:hypothetical protein K450DRAFT_221288 [Umbelopsis ramanniana AG]|uniref:Ubiquitin-like domain-containing protein n=1 Tax=Umbelopsis ramanniana AG TaxID=1314678 RepID=A0AAD5HGY5_UMBRA|nr:uncharacterized protein K450DRAFT_221288 [Umbelopsis ramanniana AG]KAI8584057.1 hypothetical protein K450DRAFT_221288 [Umbelopsis ramanniana AG]
MATDEKQDSTGQDQSQGEHSSVIISLHIKSLERTTHSVRLPRNSTVLQLKEHIQAVSQVDSQRQRLIFQGRVLKDDKNLLDYANLDDGKVVHLVVRPTGAPHNPDNDDPHSARDPHPRGLPRPRHPFGGSRFPPMEGYAFITLDTTVGEMADPGSIFFNLLNGLSANNNGLNNPDTDSNANNSAGNTAAGDNNNTSRVWHRISRPIPGPPPTNPRTNSNLRNRTHSDDSIGSEQSRTSAASSGPGTPFTSNIEYRLSRTMSSIGNVRQLLDTPVDEEIRPNPSAAFPNPSYVEEIRRRLRTSGDSPTAQVGVVVDELADLLADTIPRLRELSRGLRNETDDTTRQEQERLQLMALRSARITQGLSLINHFLGSVLGSAELEDRPQDSHVRLSGRGALDSWLSYVRSGNSGSAGLSQPSSQNSDTSSRNPITPLRATSSIQNSAASNETIRRALRAAGIDEASIQRLLTPPSATSDTPSAPPTPSTDTENRKRKQREDEEATTEQGESSHGSSRSDNKKVKPEEEASKGKKKTD